MSFLELLIVTKASISYHFGSVSVIGLIAVLLGVFVLAVGLFVTFVDVKKTYVSELVIDRGNISSACFPEVLTTIIKINLLSQPTVTHILRYVFIHNSNLSMVLSQVKT